MFAWRRPIGRLFYCLLALSGMALAQSPGMTTVADTVHGADGTPAQGVLLISWPAFTTAGGQAVGPGSTSTTLGSGGALSVNLVPNAGSTPASTFYTVVYQLSTEIKTEYWVVPSTSPATLAQVRATLGTTNTAVQVASQQYVNSAVATKANDTAVVHLAGSETISGVKQFTLSPSVPTPSGANDVANKAYVDSAAGSGVGGPFVSKTGDTMTGPLTLAADPVTASQASTRHYVDTTAGGKADLTSGLVPSGELGTGTANSGTCLLGNQSWGPCGSSSNAVQIQGVPVDTGAPSDNQVITYVASAGKYQPRAGGGVTAGMQAVKYGTDFNWSQTSATDLSTAGAKTVNLASCPAGVTGTEPQYYVYVSGTGTAEAALVTGGTCAGNGAAGTLQFTTVNGHAAGYTVGSATGGIQEALIVSRFSPDTSGLQAGKVIVTPGGEINLFARLSIRSSNITVDFSGSLLNCLMNDSCIFVGDPSSSTAFYDITLLNPHGRPGVTGGQHPFIEDNAQKTRLLNVLTQNPKSPTPTASFGSYVQVDDDQAFLLDGLDSAWGTHATQCSGGSCNAIVTTGTGAGVGWLRNMNLTLNCVANGVDWQSGNSLKITDSVIQGYPQFGVRGGVAHGGLLGTKLDNVYFEHGGCANPAGNIGAAAIIEQGRTLEIGGPSGTAMIAGVTGHLPTFPTSGSSGTTRYRYYIVAHHATFGASNALLAGFATVGGPGTITVTTPDIPGAASLDLLRITVPTGTAEPAAPYGTGAWAVAAGVTRSSACSAGVCTFSDTQAPLSSYTVPLVSYYPQLNFWPGSVILGSSQDSADILRTSLLITASGIADITSVRGYNFNPGVSVVAQYCNGGPGESSPMLASCFSDDSFSALMLRSAPDNTVISNLKGRLNFFNIGGGPSHIITLNDSNPQKTMATEQHRPLNDANDAYIGFDRGLPNGNPQTVGVSFGAPVSLSNYIGNVGDGTNWLERLTASLKEFKTNVQMDGALTVAGALQASSFTWTGSGPWSVRAGFGTLSAAPVGKSAIGFGTGGKLQVSENGGAVVEVAKLDASGNLTENANTATALAAVPTQCNGSFATGIQANGNANCGTADVIQLSETTPPTGLPNFGLFWFDQTCHCPKAISNNGQPVQLALTNVFNSDVLGTSVNNVLEERNGTAAQALRVFNSYTNSTTWDFFGLDYDNANGRYRIWSNDASSGAPGIEFQIQGTVAWYISPSLNLLTATNNFRDIGADGLGLRNLFFASFLDGETTGALVTEFNNEGTTGTTLNSLAKLTGAPSTAIIAATSDTSGVLGVVNTNSGTTCAAGTTGKACVVTRGVGTCNFDGSVTAGDYVQISSSVAGDCHDAGASYPTSGEVLGRVLVTNSGGAGTYNAYFFGGDAQAFLSASTAAATYAPLASPALTGTPTAPTPSAGDSSTKIATTAFVNQGATAPLATSFWTAGSSSVSFNSTANRAQLWGFTIPYALATTKVTVGIVAADTGGCSYDLGIVNTSGNVVVHIGNTSAATLGFTTTGAKTINWASGATALPGKYYIAITASATTGCATLGASIVPTVTANTPTTVSAGGTLNNGMAIPSDSASFSFVPSLYIQ